MDTTDQKCKSAPQIIAPFLTKPLISNDFFHFFCQQSLRKINSAVKQSGTHRICDLPGLIYVVKQKLGGALQLPGQRKLLYGCHKQQQHCSREPDQRACPVRHRSRHLALKYIPPSGQKSPVRSDRQSKGTKKRMKLSVPRPVNTYRAAHSHRTYRPEKQNRPQRKPELL